VAILNAVLETGVEPIPEVVVRVHGIAQARVSLSTRRLFVPPRLNRPTRRIVRLHYLTAQPVQITKIESDYKGITAELRPALPKPSASQPAPDGAQNPTDTRPTPKAGGAAQFSSHEILVSLPPGSDLPKGGAKLFIYTDDPDPRYSKLVILVTNKQARQRPRAPAGRSGGR
jgi:hypothetical protein